MSVTEKKNNGGFSLVELIVVIAISVVLIGAATISIRSVMGVEVKQCARNIESIINKTRVTTMGKDSAVLEIYKDAWARRSWAGSWKGPRSPDRKSTRLNSSH